LIAGPVVASDTFEPPAAGSGASEVKSAAGSPPEGSAPDCSDVSRLRMICTTCSRLPCAFS